MKTFVISIFVLFFMLFGIGKYIDYVSDITEELDECVCQISNLAKENLWEDCNIYVVKLLATWENSKKILYVFMDHGDIDEIESTIFKLKESAYFQDTHNTVIHASVLLRQIKRIEEDELPSYENILQKNTIQDQYAYDIISDQMYIWSFI